MVFIIECESVYTNLETFLQNKHLYVHFDKFSKIVFMCSNPDYERFHLVHISEIIESVHAGSKHLQILYNPGNSTGHWAYT